MASDKPSPVLLDAVKAQASKLRETKNALDARQKELDTLRAELEARNAALENQATRLKSERDEFAQERDQVIAARTSMDKDIAGIRMERDKASAEERRVQDWARTLNEREKGLTDHLKESERKIQALVEREELSAQRERALADTIDRLSVMERGMADRDRKLAKREEELIKLQNERLNSLEAREREMLKISEEMYSRQKESAAQHDSFVDLQTTLKEELISLASEREKLAVKEKSLLEAEKFISAALEASGIEIPDEPETKAPPPPPASATEMRPPRPPATQAQPPAPPMEPLRDEIFEEEPSESKPRVSRADALERMTKALETAKRARDTGRNVSEIRKVLKQARAAFEGGDYETATRLATDILRDLEPVPLPR